MYFFNGVIFKKTRKKESAGFTLIEVLVASFVIVVGVIASYIVVQQIFAQTFDASTRLTAIYLAKEGAEIVRNIRDTAWIQDLPWNTNGIGANNTYWEGEYLYTSNLTSCPGSCTFDNLRFLRIRSSMNPPFYNYSQGDNTRFKRRIKIERPTADSIKLTVDVMWQDNGIKKVTIQSLLYDWKQ